MINRKAPSTQDELDEIKHLQAFSDLTTHPEDLLSDWMDVSGLMLTTSILFYHMARSKTLRVDPRLAKVVAISLILISTLYLVYGLMTYTQRMNHTVENCRKFKKCTDKQANQIKNIKNTYIGIGAITVFAQTLIVYIILSTI
tara:strand:- start:36 stop:464 length:429 start_codon:yes stop_codon:yes gene_type:complete